jgi:hypothetical protein
MKYRDFYLMLFGIMLNEMLTWWIPVKKVRP